MSISSDFLYYFESIDVTSGSMSSVEVVDLVTSGKQADTLNTVTDFLYKCIFSYSLTVR